MDNKCAICPRPGELCPGCKDIRYCCHAHQKDDWPTHKLICKKFALRHKLQHPEKVWVLYFPVDRTEPEFRMIPIERHGRIPYGKRVRPKPATYGLRINGCSSNCRCEYTTYEEGFTDPLLHNSSCQYVYINAPEQRSPYPKPSSQSLEVNQCVKLLTGDSSWKGPVTVSARDIHQNYVDMRTKFLNRILEVFHSVVCVRINCDRLVKARKRPRFEACKIKSYDLIDRSGFHGDFFDSEGASPLTLHTGMVLLARRERTLTTPDHPHVDSRNSISRLLSIPCEISKRRFGQYTRASGTGNVIVMRQDRKPLDVEYVRILCDWISTEIRPLFKQAEVKCKQLAHHVRSGGALMRERDAVRERMLGHISKRRLLAYSGGRLIDEDTEEAEDEEMADIVENEDTTDDEMPEDGKEVDTSDDDDDMFDDESSDIQGGDDAE